MMSAAQEGDILRIMWLISMKASVNCRRPVGGATPLHIAAQHNQPAVFAFLAMVDNYYFHLLSWKLNDCFLRICIEWF